MREPYPAGGRLDPLTPNSVRRGETICGTVKAGDGGWASSPIEAGGYCNAPPTCALVALEAIRAVDSIAAISRTRLNPPYIGLDICPLF